MYREGRSGPPSSCEWPDQLQTVPPGAIFVSLIPSPFDRAARFAARYLSASIWSANPDGRAHHVVADCQEDIFSMAECLQHELDGHRGTRSMIHDYYRELLKLSDC